MSNEEIIKALKNPEIPLDKIESPIGRKMDELSDKELADIQGASDVSPETTPACVATAITVGVATFSISFCRK
ncbi:lichenicidin A2 family type 2 lantibiotic [Bacillus gibsonii]|nr:lichenicidin A2 family type 2 lantibiotic [Alkalicoccobacillus gibsonii]